VLLNDRNALCVENIYKRFSGNIVLEDVSLSLRQGEVHVLLGVDGSGKSTLVKILAGIVKADAGRILIDGVPIQLNSPRMAIRSGIGTVFQETSLVPDMTIADNVLLSYANNQSRYRPLLINWKRLNETINEIVNLLEVEIDLQQLAKNLSQPQQQIVKIIKALCTRPHIVILDEPTRGLSDVDVGQLFRAIRKLSRSGTSVLYISCRPDEIPRVADRVSVIKEGKILGTMSADETNLRSVVEMLVAETSQAMALREADRLRREFVSLVSHELRTPLATIRGYAETVMSRPWSEEIRLECLEAITSGCERLTELVDNLLDISSLEKGILRIEQEAVYLPAIVRDVCRTIKSNKRKTPNIRIRFSEHFPTVQADPRRIEQVLYNLIDNAIKYSSPDNIITVTGMVDDEHSRVVITVTDRGVGIPPEHLLRVFERFYRVPSSQLAGIEGSGLGLAICKGIIERHGGQMWAKSVIDQGSAFSFSLPLLITVAQAAHE
jgi:signal transduction histidine kinase